MARQTNRRDFLKLSTLGAIAAAFGGQLFTFGQKAWAGALALIDITEAKRKDDDNKAAVGVLKGMGYVEDADKAKVARADKPGADGKPFPAKKQTCATCGLLKEEGMVGKMDNKIVCNLAPQVYVHSKGYCNTFNVHPKAKA